MNFARKVSKLWKKSEAIKEARNKKDKERDAVINMNKKAEAIANNTDKIKS